MRKKNATLRRVAGAGALTAVAAVAAAGLGAGNAAAGALPDGSKVIKSGDGSTITQARNGEYSVPQPSVANNLVGRSVLVSGTQVVKSSDDKAEGSLVAGYLVGCQINLDGLKGGIDGTISASPSLTGSVSVPLTPGQVKFVKVGSKKVKKGVSAIQYSKVELNIQLCGGYAQARSASVVEIKGDYFVKSTLYGKPFSFN